MNDYSQCGFLGDMEDLCTLDCRFCPWSQMSIEQQQRPSVS